MKRSTVSAVLRAATRRWDVALTLAVMICLTAWSPGRSELELAVVGGGLYLTNKALLNVMERRRRLTSAEPFWFWRRWAWSIYLMGLPPIVAVFLTKDNWVFAAIEVGGVPAMLCGLVTAMKRRDPPRWLHWIANCGLLIGICLSLGNLGLSRPVTQGLETLGGIGFLVGTIMLAKDKEKGYWWFLLMGVATGTLFYVQGDYVLAAMQAVSICVVLDSQRVKRRFLATPQIADLDQLVGWIDNPYPPERQSFPFTLRLWNGHLVTVDFAGADEPVDFEQPEGFWWQDSLRPLARRLAEEGVPLTIKLRSPDRHQEWGSIWRWERHEEK